jgi:hypothetical protein
MVLPKGKCQGTSVDRGIQLVPRQVNVLKGHQLVMEGNKWSYRKASVRAHQMFTDGYS